MDSGQRMKEQVVAGHIAEVSKSVDGVKESGEGQRGGTWVATGPCTAHGFKSLYVSGYLRKGAVGPHLRESGGIRGRVTSC